MFSIFSSTNINSSAQNVLRAYNVNSMVAIMSVINHLDGFDILGHYNYHLFITYFFYKNELNISC